MEKGQYIVETSDWRWPFSGANLAAGLRRYVGDASLRVESVSRVRMAHRRPAIGRLDSILVEYRGEKGRGSCELVVKEPHGTTRTGLAGAGRREIGVYRSLAPQLPVRTPELVEASSSGDWLLLEALDPVREAANWTSADYHEAITGLARIHDRFWNLGEDLEAFAWLGRPLTADYEIHVRAAEYAIERMVHVGQPEPLAGAPERMKTFSRVTAEASKVVEPLRGESFTLLHGDYWPGNIAVINDGVQVVYDWQLASVGPAVMDLLVFATKTAWWFRDPPVALEDLVAHYREELRVRTGLIYEEEKWRKLWDHALMWRFLQEWIDLLAATPNPLLLTRADELDEIWLDPVREALDRQFGPL